MQVFLLDNGEAHSHEEEAVVEDGYPWTRRQDDVILRLWRTGASSRVIDKQLRKEGASSERGLYPTIKEIDRKKVVTLVGEVKSKASNVMEEKALSIVTHPTHVIEKFVVDDTKNSQEDGKDDSDGFKHILQVKMEIPEVRGNIGKQRNIRDVNWREEAEYEDPEQFNQSDHNSELSELMSRKNRHDIQSGQVEKYECRYSKKTGFTRCPRLLKVSYWSQNLKIQVSSNGKSHFHEQNLRYSTSKNYDWTNLQKNILSQCLNMPGKKSKVALRKLRQAGATSGGRLPNFEEIMVKLVEMKKKAMGNENTLPDNVKDKERLEDKFEHQVSHEPDTSSTSKVSNYVQDSLKPHKSKVDMNVPKKSASTIYCSPCGEERKIEACFQCETCEEDFCSECVAIHAKFKVTKSHAVKPIAHSLQFCTCCPEGDQPEPATSQCLLCQDSFCVSCTDIHAKLRATRDHVVTSLTSSTTQTHLVSSISAPSNSLLSSTSALSNTSVSSTSAPQKTLHSSSVPPNILQYPFLFPAHLYNSPVHPLSPHSYMYSHPQQQQHLLIQKQLLQHCVSTVRPPVLCPPGWSDQ